MAVLSSSASVCLPIVLALNRAGPEIAVWDIEETVPRARFKVNGWRVVSAAQRLLCPTSFLSYPELMNASDELWQSEARVSAEARAVGTNRVENEGHALRWAGWLCRWEMMWIRNYVAAIEYTIYVTIVQLKCDAVVCCADVD